jgi:hypothetical protein
MFSNGVGSEELKKRESGRVEGAWESAGIAHR